jgi:hypothetical protein
MNESINQSISPTTNVVRKMYYRCISMARFFFFADRFCRLITKEPLRGSLVIIHLLCRKRYRLVWCVMVNIKILILQYVPVVISLGYQCAQWGYPTWAHGTSN